METDPRAVTTLSAHLDYLRVLIPAGGGRVEERDGVVVFSSPVPLPFLVNCVARTDPSVSPHLALAAAAEVFESGRGFEVMCLDGVDEDLRAAAEREGYRIDSPAALQFLDSTPVAAPTERSTLEIRMAESPSDVDDLVLITQDAHEVYGFPEGIFGSIFSAPETVLADGIGAVIVRERGEPVATAQVFVVGDVAYIGWVAVVRAAMRRGLGWLATGEAVGAGVKLGAKAACLLASPMGAPLYRKMGFIDVGQLRNAQAPRATANDGS